MKEFGHMRPVRDASGAITGRKACPAGAVTRFTYSVLFAKARRIIVTLEAGDLICFREKGRRTKWSVPADSAFRQAVRNQAQRDAAERKKKKAADAEYDGYSYECLCQICGTQFKLAHKNAPHRCGCDGQLEKA